tara:strand:- start:8517 stop:9158 length:642 start_codon:yes stop_codon:yes gene_type:complete
MNKLIGIYGASGFGREVLPLVRDQYKDADLCFIDDGYESKSLNDYSVVTFEEFLAKPNTEKLATIAIADSKIRKALSEKLEKNNIAEINVSAQNAVSLDSIELGTGSILCPFVTLTSNISIGRGFHANIYSYVAHDCRIGDYVTFAPSVKCNGNVHIHDFAYIGTGAVIKQGTPDKPVIIGEGAVVGMGAVVTKNVEPYSVVVGNPAKPLRKS